MNTVSVAKKLRIKPSHIYHDENADSNKLKKTYMTLLKTSRALNLDGTPHIIIVYCGGHGASLNE